MNSIVIGIRNSNEKSPLPGLRSAIRPEHACMKRNSADLLILDMHD
jgi:hypothetical protein